MKSIDVFKLSRDELYDLYGVELRDSGEVYDPVEDKMFTTLAAWKTYTESQEDDDLYGSFQKVGGRYAYDDYEY